MAPGGVPMPLHTRQLRHDLEAISTTSSEAQQAVTTAEDARTAPKFLEPIAGELEATAAT